MEPNKVMLPKNKDLEKLQALRLQKKIISVVKIKDLMKNRI
jgi:hypothetical protein